MMNPVCLIAFEDEMSKIAGLSSFLRKVRDIFKTPEARTQKDVDYFFSDTAGNDRWRKLPQQARQRAFVDAVATNPLADEQLKMHVQSLHDLSKGSPVAKIQSATESGKTYEVRTLPGGALGCQCGDWRYKGTVNPGYECKHIRAYRDGKQRAA